MRGEKTGKNRGEFLNKKLAEKREKEKGRANDNELWGDSSCG